MDPIIQKLQEQMLANMAAGRQIPPPPPPPPAQLMNEQMQGRRGQGARLFDMLGVPGGITDAMAAGADTLADPLGAYVDDMTRFATDATRALGPAGSPLQNTLGELLRTTPQFVRGMAQPSDPETGMPNVDVAAGPLAAVKKGLGLADDAIKKAPKTTMGKLGKAKADFYDSLEGLKGFNQDLYEKARLYSGTAKKAEEEVKGFGKALDPIKAKGLKENWDDMLAAFKGEPTRFDRAGKWAMLDRLEEAAKVTGGPINGKTASEWAAERAAYEATLPADEIARVTEARDAAVKYFNAQLDEAAEAGMVSKESVEAAKRRGLKYVPLHTIADDAAEELGASMGGHSANPNVDWFRKLQESAKEVELANPFDEASVSRLSAARRNIEKNRVMSVLTELPQKDEAYKGLVIPLETADMRQARIDLSKEIQETQRKIAEVSGQINLKGKVSDVLWERFNRVIGEQANLAGELANKNLNFEPRPEIRKVIDKIQRRQKNILVTANKMKDNSASMGAIVQEIVEAEKELKIAKSELWKMRANKLPDGFKEVKHFRNGLKERWAVPADIADSLMQMNKQQVDLVTGIAAKSSKLLRSGATSLNMTFLPTNVIRDAGTLAIRSENGINPVNLVPRWIEGFYHAMAADDVYKSFIKDGGGYSTFAEVMNARPSVAGQGIGARFANTVKSPTQLFEAVTKPLTWLNETAELAPRLAEYQAAIRAGKTAEKAAMAARDVTVDFMKAGDITRVANMWVPFLNANLQGTANTLKTFRDGGPSAYLKMGAMVGVPAATTYIWNTSKFPDVWDDISANDKENNHILILGRNKDQETGRYYTDIVRIPKNQFSKLVANPIEQSLDYARKNKPAEYSRIAMKMAGTLSPLGGVDDEGEFSIADVGSQALPPWMKAPLEYGFNKNFYTGRDIVPGSMQDRSPELQYYPGETPQSMVALGGATGLSPLKMEQFVRSTMGGLGGHIMDPANVKKDFERRFGKAYGGQLDRDQIKELDKLKTTESDAKARFQIFLQERMKTPKEDRPPVTEEQKKVIEAGKPTTRQQALNLGESFRDRKELSPLESRLKNGGYSADTKEKWARPYIATLTPEERKSTLKRWREYKVLSGALLDKLEKEMK